MMPLIASVLVIKPNNEMRKYLVRHHLFFKTPDIHQ